MRLRDFFSTPHLFILFACLTGLTLRASGASGQIVLENAPLGLKPAQFHISRVYDDRESRGPLAKLLVSGQNGKFISRQMDLQGGIATEVGRYLNKNLPRNERLTAVAMGIRNLEVNETQLANGSIEGRVKLVASYGLPKSHGIESLVTTQHAIRYVRPARTDAPVETHIRNLLKSSLAYFNNWINSQAATDPRLARNVKFTFSDYSEKTEGDTIYYSPKRKLRWDDFQSRNMYSYKYQALVMPGLGYDHHAKIVNGTVHVHISMKAYLPKSAAWSRATGRDSYTLNHEQRHFDIVKIIAEQFKEKVTSAGLQPDTYDAFLNMQYLDSFRDMHAMQKAYDKETSHGLNRSAQAAWDDKIDKLLGL